MKLADALVEALKAFDVRYVFGVSGANIEHFHDAIHRLGDGRLRSVLARCESGAAFMADCRARVHRTLGVCCSTSGGAMLNLTTGIAEAFAESVPLLAIVGQPPAELEGRGAFQDSSGIGRTVDAERLLAAVTKYTAKIDRPEVFWPCLTAAIHASFSGRPGPTALLVPRSMWESEVGPFPEDFVANLRRRTRPPAVPPAVVRTIFDKIRNARAPVLLVGQGVRRSRGGDSVAEFALRARIPVMTTMSARGEFPNDDPLYLGVLGVAGHPSAHEYMLHRADLIVAAGSGLSALTRQPLAADGLPLKEKELVAVNVDAGAIERVHRSGAIARTHLVAAEVGRMFEGLLDLYEAEPFETPPLNGYRRDTLEAMLPQGPVPGGAHEEGMLQSEALAILGRHVPAGGHLVYDAGNCAAGALHWLDAPRGSSVTIALGMGGMGYAVAGAVGAQLGSPSGARTLVVAGDGAFMMTGFEVHTAVELGLPILYAVFNNGMHGMCVTRQEAFFEGRVEAATYHPPDFSKLARGFAPPERLWTRRVRSPEELEEALADYELDLERPGVLDICIDREELPPFLPLRPVAVPPVPPETA